MSEQYLHENNYIETDSEYQADELKKRLKFSLANFAQVRFKHSMKMRIFLTGNA